MDNVEVQEPTAGSEGEQEDNSGTSPVVDSTPTVKTVPESDLLAVKSALESRAVELKAAQESLAMERAKVLAAEKQVALVEGLTKERDTLSASNQEMLTKLAVMELAQTDAMRADLINRGVAEERVKGLSESELKLLQDVVPAASKDELIKATGLDVSGAGMEDMVGLSAREKLARGLSSSRQ